MRDVRTPSPVVYEPILSSALREDLGRGGDVTTDAVMPAGAMAVARVITREPGYIAGLAISCRAFTLLDERIEVDIKIADGAVVEARQVLAVVSGPARPIFAAERVALNLLGRLSGIATATGSMVEAVAGTGARVVCTRKTTPGLRALEKYAVRAGGGFNHRFGLDGAVLIKDNHIVMAGGIGEALKRARAEVDHLVKIEVEVETLAQLEEALETGVDAVLLDNMDLETLRKAVEIVGGRVVIEASGGIDLDNAADVAKCGVDVLSVGWLTHSAPALDVTLEAEAV